jgi:hypothetical protein
MASKVDWKQKYEGLRSKYINAMDVAFRLGVEEGSRAAEMQALQQQVMQMQEQAAMQAQAGMMGGEVPPEEMPPEEGGEEMPPEEMMAEEAPPEEGGGDELGASIDELESYVKSEKKESKLKDLLKSYHKSEVGKKKKETPKSERYKKVAEIVAKWEGETDDVDPIGEA